MSAREICIPQTMDANERRDVSSVGERKEERGKKEKEVTGYRTSNCSKYNLFRLVETRCSVLFLFLSSSLHFLLIRFCAFYHLENTKYVYFDRRNTYF